MVGVSESDLSSSDHFHNSCCHIGWSRLGERERTEGRTGGEWFSTVMNSASFPHSSSSQLYPGCFCPFKDCHRAINSALGLLLRALQGLLWLLCTEFMTLILFLSSFQVSFDWSPSVNRVTKRISIIPVAVFLVQGFSSLRTVSDMYSVLFWSVVNATFSSLLAILQQLSIDPSIQDTTHNSCCSLSFPFAFAWVVWVIEQWESGGGLGGGRPNYIGFRQPTGGVEPEQPDALMPNARGEHEQGGMGKKGKRKKKKERSTVRISYNDIWKTPSGQI